MIRKILVPLDGSEFSEKAVPHAVTLAKCFGAELELVTVMHTVEETVLLSPDSEQAIRGYNVAHPLPKTVQMPNEHKYEAEDYLKGMQRKLVADGCRVGIEILEGNAGPALVEYAENSQADLVVISSHGYGGLKRALLGSVADHLVSHLRVPVMVVRPEPVPVAKE